MMDKNEFISLVLPLKDRLFRVAWCILRSKEEAEDIVQDVMLKVWRDEKERLKIWQLIVTPWPGIWL